MAASSFNAAMDVDDLVEDLQLHEVILQSLDEQRPGAVEERQEIVDTIKDLQTKLARLRGETPQKSQQYLSVRQSTPTSSSAGSIGQVDGGYEASPFDNSSRQSPQPSPSQHAAGGEGERHRGPFPIRKRRLSSESSVNPQPPTKRPQANDPPRSNPQIESSQDNDELDEGGEELRMLLGLDNADTIAAFQDEQRQAEEELKKKKDQERRDAEFARVLHESVFDQQQPTSTVVPAQREPEHKAHQHRNDHAARFRAGLFNEPRSTPTNSDSSLNFSKMSINPQVPGIPAKPSSMGAFPQPNTMSFGTSPFMNHVHPQAQANRLNPHTMAQPLPKVPTSLAKQEVVDDDIQEINRNEFQPSNRVYFGSYTPPALARPGSVPVKREGALYRPLGSFSNSPNSLRNTMSRLTAGRQMLQEAGKSVLGGLPRLYDAVTADPMRNVIQNGSDHGFTDTAADDYMNGFYGEDVDPRQAKEEIKKLLETIRPDLDISQQNREGTPEALKVTLLEHQKVGLSWMKNMEESDNKGGILADDMGLGKTLQAIALMVSRPSNNPERKPTLVVAPVALMQQWKREIEKLLRPGKYQLSVFILHGEKRSATFRDLKHYDVVLTTFGTLSSELKRKEKYQQLHNESGSTEPLPRAVVNMLPCLGPTSKWHRVIVDEAQCIKNRNTKSALACCQIDATYRWCMSGTPMMNNVEELHSLIKFLRIRPYSSLEKFNMEFTRPLKRDAGPGFDTAMKQLQVLLKAILLRRTKYSKIDGRPILQLPPRVSEKVHAVFDEDERQLYTALETKSQIQFSKYLDNGSIGRNYSSILVLLLRLRQACCHPHLMSDFSVKVNTNTNTSGVDLVVNAKAFGDEIIIRLRDNPNMECPICIDAVDNPTIFFPCGHGACAECFAKISDPSAAVEQGNDGAVEVKCPNCRARIDPEKITDHATFKKVHFPDPSDEANEANEAAENEAKKPDEKPESDEETDSDSDDEDSDGDLSKFIVKDNDYGYSDRAKGKGKKVKMGPKKSLAELKKEGHRNQRAKRKYIRRLEKRWVSSAKIDKALEILQEIEDRNDGQKTIIFSQFTSLLDLLEVPIARRGWGYRRYDGSMRPQDRNAAVLDFTDTPECKVMLVSLKAGNSGLNLIAASQVIIFDPFWNPYIEEQAIDRAHRIGQQRQVQIHRILVEKTVEDRILELQDKKRTLIEGALDENASKSISRLGARELGYLFGVNV